MSKLYKKRLWLIWQNNNMSKPVRKNLIIHSLNVSLGLKKILQNINLTIKPGRITALLGPNGSGKSTLAQVLAGHKDYKVSGQIIWQGKNIQQQEPWERARAGLFLSFQNPVELPGVNLFEFLSGAYRSIWGPEKFTKDFSNDLQQARQALQLTESFLDRPVNFGLSGGEKKRSEILQLLVLKPRLAVLDETDSGLDIDSLKLIARQVNKLKFSQIGFLVITHYQRLLNYLRPAEVVVLLDGQIVKRGDGRLVKELESKGYEWLRKKAESQKLKLTKSQEKVNFRI